MHTVIHARASADDQCHAWATTNPERPGRYTVMMFSPWNGAGPGTIYSSAAEASAAVDHLIDVWYTEATAGRQSRDEAPAPAPAIVIDLYGEERRTTAAPIILTIGDQQYQLEVDERGRLVVIGLEPFRGLTFSCPTSSHIRLSQEEH